MSWLIFVVIALNEVSPIPAQILASFQDGPPRPERIMQLLLMALCAYVLLLSEKHLAQFYKTVIDIYRSIPLPRDNFIYRFIIRFSWVPILMIGGIALALPNTLGYKATVTLLVLLFGWLCSTVLRQAISSILNFSKSQNKVAVKFFSYFVFVHFIVAALKIWA